eukprot:223288_1
MNTNPSISDANHAIPSHKQSLLSIAESVSVIKEEQKRHDKYHKYFAKIQYIFILIMGALYLIYGITRYAQSARHHRVNTYITNTDISYPVPVTMVCQDASAIRNNSHIHLNSFVNITQLVIDTTAFSINPHIFNPQISFIDNPLQILNLSRWNALQFFRNKTFLYVYKNGSIEFNVTVLFQCQVILPPIDRAFNFGYLQNYLYHKPGLGTVDSTLKSWRENISIPQYMTKQFEIKLIHRIFHFDALYSSIKNKYPHVSTHNLTLSQVALAAFSYGITIYAAPWSVTNFIMSLITHKYLRNNLLFTHYNTIDSFDINTVSSLSEIYDIPTLIAPNVSQDTAIISFNHFPHQQNAKLTGNCTGDYHQCNAVQRFYHQYDEEYMEYTFFDLLSGLGGIVTGSYSFSALVIKLLLFGFAFGKFRFKGLAPYPSMNKTERDRLRRFNKIEGPGVSGNQNAVQ